MVILETKIPPHKFSTEIRQAGADFYTFWAQSVYVFVWMLEQTAVTSL